MNSSNQRSGTTEMTERSDNPAPLTDGELDGITGSGGLSTLLKSTVSLMGRVLFRGTDTTIGGDQLARHGSEMSGGSSPLLSTKLTTSD